ncbi:spore maturation protein [Thermobrachium celere]|uniref:Spore maturation protein B n=1 Tax=Thermobrachium celere DSM 8682 TaxID=941824 RepID=R7RPE6_9CLOT|nr:nucleoside recognition domain-containing protein [Thermobrachium celere]GFR34466.1 spore maturation protein B [Thermobrachium celere]CDF57188.1 Spore maturation protein B [Thermobrachium celere DSM 8682]
MISKYFIPLFILFVLIYSVFKGIKVYEVFVEGAKEGLKTVFNIAPYLLTMLFAIDVFRRSGALNGFINLLAPVTKFLNIPDGVLPMILIKPLSGSGAISVMTDIMKTYGVDSTEGLIAAIIMGSSETIFYTISLYFGSIGVKKIRHALIVALIAHFISSVIVCNFILNFL